MEKVYRPHLLGPAILAEAHKGEQSLVGLVPDIADHVLHINPHLDLPHQEPRRELI